MVKVSMLLVLFCCSIGACASADPSSCPVGDGTENVYEPAAAACEVGETRCIVEARFAHDPNFVIPQVCGGDAGVFVSAPPCDLRVNVCAHGACVAAPDACN